MTLTLGVDIGGTKIAAGVVDADGAILARARSVSPATDVAAIEDTVVDLVEKLRVEHAVTAVGVGAAGFVDADRSTVLFAPNLAWREEPLGADLAERLDLPVVVENDANAAAWGEFAFGAGRDVEDLLLVTVGTGVGGGLVLSGDLRRGAFGVGAEIGHLTMVRGGRPCGCGNRGCWEQYASGTALVRDSREQALAHPDDAAALIERAGGDPATISGPLVTEAAAAGDAFAVARLAELGDWLGAGIASLSAVLDPGLVVVGGGVAAAGDLLVVPLRESFAASLTGRGHRPEAPIVRALLGNDAGMIGAADLARR